MSGLYQFLCGSRIAPENLQNQLQGIFEEFLEFLGSPCGIIVLYSEVEKSYLEVASVGFGDSDFFYEFMVRGMGNFENVSKSNSQVLFPALEFQLFHSESDIAIASRIYPGEMKGFVLVESPPGNREWRKWLVGLIAFRITNILQNKEEIVFKSTQLTDQSENTVAPILLSQIPSWESKFKEGLRKRVITLRRKPGSGEKSIIRNLFQRLQNRGDLVFINSIPEQVVKLERYLSEWIEIAGNGFLVFEKLEAFTIAQQKLFAKIIPEIPGPCFVFLSDVQQSPIEEFPLFWRFVHQTEIYIPELPSLDIEIRKKIITAMVHEIFYSQSKKGMEVDEDVSSFLIEKSETQSLEEIYSVLELAILQSRGDRLRLAEMRNLWTGKIKNLGLIDEEDLDLRKSVENLEKQKILQAMKLFSGNQMRMSKALGISRGSLQYKMKQMGLL